jgi:1,4-alpha-glucan branching enzyme
VANFTPQSHSHYRVGVPLEGFYEEVFNTDAARYGGSNLGNLGGKFTDEWSIHGYEHSLDLCLPPLSVLVFRRDEKRSQVLPAAADHEASEG